MKMYVYGCLLAFFCLACFWEFSPPKQDPYAYLEDDNHQEASAFLEEADKQMRSFRENKVRDAAEKLDLYMNIDTVTTEKYQFYFSENHTLVIKEKNKMFCLYEPKEDSVILRNFYPDPSSHYVALLFSKKAKNADYIRIYDLEDALPVPSNTNGEYPMKGEVEDVSINNKIIWDKQGYGFYYSTNSAKTGYLGQVKYCKVGKYTDSISVIYEAKSDALERFEYLSTMNSLLYVSAHGIYYKSISQKKDSFYLGAYERNFAYIGNREGCLFYTFDENSSYKKIHKLSYGDKRENKQMIWGGTFKIPSIQQEYLIAFSEIGSQLYRKHLITGQIDTCTIHKGEILDIKYKKDFVRFSIGTIFSKQDYQVYYKDFRTVYSLASSSFPKLNIRYEKYPVEDDSLAITLYYKGAKKPKEIKSCSALMCVYGGFGKNVPLNPFMASWVMDYDGILIVPEL
ncbi:MAG: hypothetical protein ACKVTZ_17060, partial [Bacteroidia bacterium]